MCWGSDVPCCEQKLLLLLLPQIQQVRCFGVVLHFGERIEVELVKEAFHAVSFKNSARSFSCRHFLYGGFFISGDTDAIINTTNGLKMALKHFPELLWKSESYKFIGFMRGLL